MKSAVAALLSCFAISFSATSFAWGNDACGQGSCGGSDCDYYQTSCQCTDPACNKGGEYTDCTSRSRCCEATGNIGAR